MNVRAKKIAILDIDNCLHTWGIRGKWTSSVLSPELITHINKHGYGYSELYLCTHRTVQAYEHLIDRIPLSNLEWFDLTDIFIDSIIERLQDDTGLQCVAVSTPHDNGIACGDGYKNILQPAEARMAASAITLLPNKASSITKVLNACSKESKAHMPPVFSSISKNVQLEQIMHHARQRHLDGLLEFDFFDDVADICQSATSLPLPANVAFTVYQHSAFDQNGINRVERIKSHEEIVQALKEKAGQSTALSDDEILSLDEIIKQEQEEKAAALGTGNHHATLFSSSSSSSSAQPSASAPRGPTFN